MLLVAQHSTTDVTALCFCTRERDYREKTKLESHNVEYSSTFCSLRCEKSYEFPSHHCRRSCCLSLSPCCRWNYSSTKKTLHHNTDHTARESRQRQRERCSALLSSSLCGIKRQETKTKKHNVEKTIEIADLRSLRSTMHQLTKLSAFIPPWPVATSYTY